jgi:hypothetical protein
MRVDLPSIRSLGFTGQSPSLLSDWRVGAILQATAIRDARTGELWLKIADLKYPARIASGDGAGPADGERLTLRVLRNSPVLALETLASETSTNDEVASDALRKYLPRQASPAPLMSNLAWIANGKGSAERLPLPVAQAAAKLWQALPDMNTLSDPKGLQNAIARSGTFLESTLATADRRTLAATVATDVKALMLNLTRVLRDHGARQSGATTDATSHSPVPVTRGPLTALPAAPATLAVLDTSADQMNELARQADGAVSRMTALQVSNVPQDAPLQSLLLELPVRHGDRTSVLRLRVEQDRSRRHESGGSDSWTMEAALDLGAVGALHSRVTLMGHRIGVQLRAESPSVVNTLSARAPELESMLREAGLEIDRVVCLHGMPAGDTGVRTTRLLDVRA